MAIKKTTRPFFLFFLAFGSAAYRQFDQGQISGTVKDPSDASVAGATVKAQRHSNRSDPVEPNGGGGNLHLH